MKEKVCRMADFFLFILLLHLYLIMKRALNIIRNKYIIASLAFLTWMLFFDRNDISSQYQYRSQLKELQQEKEFYLKEIREVEIGLENLSTNPKKLEKFAREKYFMKKDNEDVYVIIHEDPKAP